MKKIRILAAAAAVAIGCASAQQPKPEDQLKLRKASYQVMNYALGNLDAMAEGKRPYSRDEAVRYAEIVARVAALPRGFFGEGTDKVGETRAKPEIWTHRADFDTKMDKMTHEAAGLPQAAASGDVAVLRKAVGELADACKACHDEYRQKQRP